MKKVAKEVIDQINAGERESSNLMEFLAADFQKILQNTVPEFNFPKQNLQFPKKCNPINLTAF